MDIPARETLEAAFLAYKGTILLFPHDRYFTAQVASEILIFEMAKRPTILLGMLIILKENGRQRAGAKSQYRRRGRRPDRGPSRCTKA